MKSQFFIFGMLALTYLLSQVNAVSRTEYDAIVQINTAFSFGWTFDETNICSAMPLSVQCSRGSITSLILPPTSNNVPFPTAIKNLTFLTELELYSGYDIPSTYWQDVLITLPNLVTLTCNDKCFSRLPANMYLYIPTSLENLYLNNVTVTLPSDIFEVNIETISITNYKDGLNLPILKYPNGIVKSLTITANDKGIPESYVNFNYLQSLVIYTYHNSFDFNLFNQLPSLLNLKIYFTNDIGPVTQANFPNSLLKPSKISTLLIDGDGYTSSTPVLNFNQTSIKKLTINHAPSLFKSLQYPSIIPTTPTFQSIDLDYNNMTTWQVDIFNFNIVSMQYNQISEPMPSGNYSVLTSLAIQHNQITGQVPPNLCHSFETTINYNNFTGPAPNCFKCSPSLVAPYVFPNNFSDFFNGSLQGCPSFSINETYNRLVPTTGGYIFIEGQDFGWTSVGTLGKSQLLNVIIPNKLLRLTIPAGTGTNYTSQHKFDDRQVSYTFSYGYQPPVVTNVFGSAGQTTTQLIGTNLGISTNFAKTNVTFNGQQVEVVSANYSTVIVKYSLPTTDTQVAINISVGGQYFTNQVLALADLPVITKPYPTVSSTGGILSFVGNHFGDRSTDLLQVMIGNCSCKVTASNNTNIQCTVGGDCSQSKPGFADVYLQIGATSTYSFSGSAIVEITTKCPGDTEVCSGNGSCNFTNGTCTCSNGFEGLDCSTPTHSSSNTLIVNISMIHMFILFLSFLLI